MEFKLKKIKSIIIPTFVPYKENYLIFLTSNNLD